MKRAVMIGALVWGWAVMSAMAAVEFDLAHNYIFGDMDEQVKNATWHFVYVEDEFEDNHSGATETPWSFRCGYYEHDDICIGVTGCGEEKVVPTITLGTARASDGLSATVLTDAELFARFRIGELEYTLDDEGEMAYENEDAHIGYYYPNSLWPNGSAVEGRQWILVSLGNVKIGSDGFFSPKTFTVGIEGTELTTPTITIIPDDELPPTTQFTPSSVFGLDIVMVNKGSPHCAFEPFFGLWAGADLEGRVPYCFDMGDDEEDDQMGNMNLTISVPASGDVYIKLETRYDAGSHTWCGQLSNLTFSGEAYGSISTIGTATMYSDDLYWLVLHAQSAGEIKIEFGEYEKLLVNGIWFKPESLDAAQCVALEAWCREHTIVANGWPTATYSGFVTGLGVVGFGQQATLVCHPNSGKKLDHWEFVNCTQPSDATVESETLTFTVTQSMYDEIAASSDPLKRLIVQPVFAESGEEEVPQPEFTIVDNVLTGVTLNGVTEITIPDNVTSIGSRVFFNCSDLTKVTLPDGLKSIGSSAFGNCSGLTSITIPDSVETINESAFNGCAGLEAINMGNGVRDIGSFAFGECTSLREVEFSNCITNIGMYAFIRCSSLASINLPDNGVKLNSGTFAYCTNLANIEIPESVTGVDGNTFLGCSKLWAKWIRAMEQSSDVDAIALTVTNVVVHYVTNSKPSEAVTPPMTEGLVNIVSEVTAGSAVAISSDWAAQYEGFEGKFGADFGKAITKPTGKRDAAGREMYVWQDFVAGTDPMDEDDVFTASITFDAAGNTVISWTPELTEAEADKRVYRKYGKVKLNDTNWTEITGDETDNYNFFKVSVEMK